MRLLFLFTSLTLSMWGCSEKPNFRQMDNLGLNKTKLQITTRILIPKSTLFNQEFQEGAILGLNVTNEDCNDLYNGIYKYRNVCAKAYMNRGEIHWQQTPEVILNEKNAIIYAYHPYRKDLLNVKEIPVKLSPDASKTDDYMYGSHAIGQKNVNRTAPVVMLYMNHALSLIAFQLNLSTEKKGAYIVNMIQIGNKPGGTCLVSEGVMDITTGDIHGSTDKSTLTATGISLANPVILINDQYCAPLHIMVIPTAHKIKEGDVEVLFMINGETFKFKIPSNSFWEKGKRYLYKLSFNGKKLILNKTYITEWLPGHIEKNQCH